MNQNQIDSLHRLEAGGKVRVMISQDTFDESVKETMDDFDMSFEEAVQEAIEQFTMQGVDLRNIRHDDPAERVNVTAGVKAACDTLRAAVLATEASEPNVEGERLPTPENTEKALGALKDLLQESEISDERRAAAGEEGAVGIIAAINTWMVRERALVVASFEVLASLVKLEMNKEAMAGCCGRNPAAGALIGAIAHYINDEEVKSYPHLHLNYGCYPLRVLPCWVLHDCPVVGSLLIIILDFRYISAALQHIPPLNPKFLTFSTWISLQVVIKGLVAARGSMLKFEQGKVTFDEAGMVEHLVVALKAQTQNPPLEAFLKAPFNTLIRRAFAVKP